MSLWDSLGAPLVAIVNKLIPDKAAAAAAASQMQALVESGQLQQELLQLQALTVNQTDVNKAEAANPSMWVAGARPFILWVCGIGFAVQFLIAPFATWFASLAGHPTTFPILDGNTLMSLTFGMLGLGAYRSYDKLKGTDTKAVGK